MASDCPSTTLRVVPLPIACGDREDSQFLSAFCTAGCA